MCSRPGGPLGAITRCGLNCGDEAMGRGGPHHVVMGADSADMAGDPMVLVLRAREKDVVCGRRGERGRVEGVVPHVQVEFCSGHVWGADARVALGRVLVH